MTDRERIILKHIQLAEERTRLICVGQSNQQCDLKFINNRISEITHEMKSLEEIERNWDREDGLAGMSDLRMLTNEETAEFLNVSTLTLTTLREIGVIRAIKTGKCYMFSQEEIRRFQSEYAGYDVSNKVKALEAYKKVTAATVTKNN